MIQQRLPIYLYIVCAALAVGSLGPWFTGTNDYPGTSTSGTLTLFGAGFAGMAVWRWTVSQRRWMLGAVQVVAALCAATAIYALYDFSIDDAQIGADRVGWGLILTLVCAIALAGLCLLQNRQARSAP